MPRGTVAQRPDSSRTGRSMKQSDPRSIVLGPDSCRTTQALGFSIREGRLY